MAFCAKCGTPLNEAGVCPNCGYVLPQNKRPVQAGPAAGSESSEVTEGPVNSQMNPGGYAAANAGDAGPVPGNPQENPAQGMGQGQMAAGAPQGQPYYGMPQNGVPAGGQQPYYNNNTAPGYGNGSGAYGQGSQMGYGPGPNGYNAGQNGYNPQGGPSQGPQVGQTCPQMGYNQGQGGPQMGQTGPQMGQSPHMGQNGPYYGGPQGQPYYGQMPPRQPSELGNNILQWFLGIFQKDPSAVFEKAGSSKSPVWAIYMAIYAFFGALAIAFSVGSLLSVFGDIGDLGFLEEIFERASIQSAIISFIAGLLFYAAIMFLTSLMVWLLMIILGKKISYWSACNVTMVAYIPTILATVFDFICSFTFVTSIIAFVVSSVASIATMILLYCGISRLSENKKSAVWPYVIAQAALKVVTVIIAVIFIFVCVLILSTMLAAMYRPW